MKIWVYYTRSKPTEHSKNMKPQSLFNWLLFVLCAANLGVLIGFADWSDNRMSELEKKPTFRQAGSFLAEDYHVIRMHFDDYRFLRDLDLLKDCDVEDVMNRIRGKSSQIFEGMSPICIPNDGPVDTNWAIWDQNNGKWRSYQTASGYTDMVSVFVKK